VVDPHHLGDVFDVVDDPVDRRLLGVDEDRDGDGDTDDASESRDAFRVLVGQIAVMVPKALE
jgi:hypothetical protein